MPPGDLSSAELAAMYLAIDGTQTHTSEKLRKVGLDQTEALYMAISYGFDAQRKFQYLCRILLRSAQEHERSGEANDELRQIAKELLQDELTLNDSSLTWHKRAELTEARMRELHESVTKERDRLLRHFAGESGEKSS
jgi:hypothetical protein